MSSKIVSKLISFWVQIRDLYLYFFRQALIVNAWVDDHTWHGIKHRNWGDDINFYFIQELTQRPVVSLFNFRIARKFKFKNFLCIGSLLGMPGYANENTIVWGAGSFGELNGIIPSQILSVRGRLTSEILFKKGIDCQNVFGDPALLLPLVYMPEVSVKCSEGQVISSKSQIIGFKYKLGIVPHVVDLQHPIIKEIREKYSTEILIIDLEHYGKWTDVIDQICSCEKILSSSLHGIIVSDAYGIPNCWIELTGKLLGGHFKYHDYASSVGRLFDEPICIKQVGNILSLCESFGSFFSFANPKVVKKIQNDIIKVAPFPLQIKVE